MGFFTTDKKRKSRRDKRAKHAQEKQQRQQDLANIERTPLPTDEEAQQLQERTGRLATAEGERAQQARQGFKEEALKDVTTELPGLTPKARQAMQESANRQIGAQLQNYSRMLASSQGNRGVRGGHAQSDLRRQALDAQNQVRRDLNEQDAGLAMQRLAAYLSAVEGRSSEDILRQQQFRDYLTGEQERRRKAAESRYFNNYFGKV